MTHAESARFAFGAYETRTAVLSGHANLLLIGLLFMPLGHDILHVERESKGLGIRGMGGYMTEAASSIFAAMCMPFTSYPTTFFEFSLFSSNGHFFGT